MDAIAGEIWLNPINEEASRLFYTTGRLTSEIAGEWFLQDASYKLDYIARGGEGMPVQTPPDAAMLGGMGALGTAYLSVGFRELRLAWSWALGPVLARSQSKLRARDGFGRYLLPGKSNPL